MRRKMPDSNDWDENMTDDDLDKIKKVLSEFEDAFAKLTHVFNECNGDVNEIIWMKDKSMQWCRGSIDDVYSKEFITWLANCMSNILDYRLHLEEKRLETKAKHNFQVCIEQVAKNMLESPDVRTDIEYLLADKWKGDEENFFKAYKREIAEMEEEV